MKIKDFPFDTQCCEILFYSWAHTARQMKILQYDNKNFTNVTHISHNTEWTIYHTCASNKTIVTSENLFWWVTNHVIYIKRQSIYHIYTIVLPCGVLSCLSILLFLLPPDSGEKITLGVTILLAFFVNSLVRIFLKPSKFEVFDLKLCFQKVVSNYTPEASSDLPIIGIYYLFNIGLVSLSIALSVYVLNLHFRGHKLYPVPNWIKTILLMGDDHSYNLKRPQFSFSYNNTRETTFTANETKVEICSNGIIKRYDDQKYAATSEPFQKAAKKEKTPRTSTNIPCVDGSNKRTLSYEIKIAQILKLFYRYAIIFSLL